jgi:hypothetical protein
MIDPNSANWPRISAHGITIGGKHSFRDLGMVSQEILTFQPPELKTQIVDIPGSDGELDLSEALTGRPIYQNRKGSFHFVVLHGKNYASAYSAVMQHIHGKQLRAVLDDDPLYYYEGRFTVNSWLSKEYASEIVIDYNVAPYKCALDGTEKSL